MMDSKGDKGTESEGYTTTNTYINPATETQTNSQINETTPTHKTTPPKDKPTAKSNQLTNTDQQPSHQKSHTQITKIQTNPVSKLRVDGEFTGCTKDRTVRDTFVSELL